MKRILSLIIVLIIFSNCSGEKSNADLLKEKVTEIIIAFKENSPEKLKNTIASNADLDKIQLESKIEKGEINELKRYSRNIGNVSYLKKIKSDFKGTEKEWKNIKPYGFFESARVGFDNERMVGKVIQQKIFFSSKDIFYKIDIFIVFLDNEIFLLHIQDDIDAAGSKKQFEKQIKTDKFKENTKFIKI